MWLLAVNRKFIPVKLAALRANPTYFVQWVILFIIFVNDSLKWKTNAYLPPHHLDCIRIAHPSQLLCTCGGRYLLLKVPTRGLGFFVVDENGDCFCKIRCKCWIIFFGWMMSLLDVCACFSPLFYFARRRARTKCWSYYSPSTQSNFFSYKVYARS